MGGACRSRGSAEVREHTVHPPTLNFVVRKGEETVDAGGECVEQLMKLLRVLALGL